MRKKQMDAVRQASQGARASAAAGAVFLAMALAAACATETDVAPKTGTWTPPRFDSAKAFSTLVADAPTLCSAGTTEVAFDRDGQSVAFVIPLNRGATLELETRGDPDLDTVVALYGPADDTGYFGRTAVASDDDGGEGALSRLGPFTAPAAGRYLALLTTWDGTGRGAAQVVATVDGKPGCTALRPELPPLDLLFVVDDSTSMSQEQFSLATGLREFLARLDPNDEADFRIAVTSTNVCPRGRPEAIRGRFLYQPALNFPPDAVVKRVIPCLTDADCQARTDLPDAANWVCETRPAQEVWTCDRPAAVQSDLGEDNYAGDLLFTVASQCRYRCSESRDPEGCTHLFGVGPRCRATCGEAGCSAEDCASVGLTMDRCERACASGSCQAFCEAYLGEATACADVCASEACDTTCGTTFFGAAAEEAPHFLCAVACGEAGSCETRCVAEFRDRGEHPYMCAFPGGDATKAGCMMQPMGDQCPEGVPPVLTRQVARDFVGLWREGLWRGDPSWGLLSEEDLERQVLSRLLGCQVFVGQGQTVCGNQEQGLRAAWMALDPEGENGEQARQFLRDEATLVVAVISDEDDCSAPEYEKAEGVWTNVVSAEDFGRCACLRDEAGCLAAGGCDTARCLTAGEFDAAKCPLLQPSRFVTSLRGLKADPSKVLFAAFGGDVVPGSATSPWGDGAAIRQRFFDCRCDAKAPKTAPWVYACMSDLGRADLGSRYLAAVQGFGGQGRFWNLCDGIDLGSLADFVRTAVGADVPVE